MNEYQYATLRGLGEALYKHAALIKRAEEAKIAMVNIEALVRSKPFKTIKRTAQKVNQANDKLKKTQKGNSYVQGY